eukprot:3058971-Pyramimonas_sp.AAC.1
MVNMGSPWEVRIPFHYPHHCPDRYIPLRAPTPSIPPPFACVRNVSGADTRPRVKALSLGP